MLQPRGDQHRIQRLVHTAAHGLINVRLELRLVNGYRLELRSGIVLRGGRPSGLAIGVEANTIDPDGITTSRVGEKRYLIRSIVIRSTDGAVAAASS